MDDWPRSMKGYIGLYNVDASMWAWFFSDSMEKLSRTYEPESNESYKQIASDIKKSINELLLDQNDRIYKDLLH